MSKFEMDMTTGKIGGKILIFSIPLMLSGILQLLYGAFDIIVLGQFSSYDSMAAVSSTASLVALFVNFFMGLSVGGSVIMSRYYASHDFANCRKTVHTSIMTSLICGIIITIFGVLFSTPILKMMNTSANLLERSSLYLKIYFAGIIFNIVYNFGAAILRAVGDTKRPLIYLVVAGVLNVGLNYLFVVGLKLDVAGVALGTIISEAVSAILVIYTLMRSEGALNLALRELKIDKRIFVESMKIGLPAGLQSVVFNISNVMIQKNINSYGDVAIAGNGVASSLEGFVYTGMNAVYQAAISFTSQNLGAGKPKNITKILIYSYIYVFLADLVLGGGILLFSDFFISIYNNDPGVMQYAYDRLLVLLLTYFLCGFMDVTSGVLRGIGRSTLSMLMTVIGIVGVRITWLLFIYPLDPSLFNLYISYPISWIGTWLCELIVFIVLYRNIMKLVKKNANKGYSL